MKSWASAALMMAVGFSISGLGAGAPDGQVDLVSGLSFQTIDPPGAVTSRSLGINEAGDVVGLYRDATRAMHGFVRDRTGAFSTIDIDGATFTIVHGINNMGAVTGRFGDASTGQHRGFLLDSGVVTIFDFPGSNHIEPEDINERSDISGKYLDPDGVQHGFGLSAGVFQTIDVAGATSTDAQSIGNSGTVVGDIGVDIGGIELVESFTRSGSVTEVFAIPGATVTAARFRSESGTIVGIVVDATGQHGFRREVSGDYVSVDVPGATQTSIFAGNDRGDVAGSYVTGGVEHAFIGLKRPH